MPYANWAHLYAAQVPGCPPALLACLRLGNGLFHLGPHRLANQILKPLLIHGSSSLLRPGVIGNDSELQSLLTIDLHFVFGRL